MHFVHMVKGKTISDIETREGMDGDREEVEEMIIDILVAVMITGSV